jgi:hypothetical protein
VILTPAGSSLFAEGKIPFHAEPGHQTEAGIEGLDMEILNNEVLVTFKPKFHK